MKKVIIVSLTVLFGLLHQNATAQNIEDESSRKTAKIRQNMPVENNQKTAEAFLKEEEELLNKMETIQKKMSKLKFTNPQHTKLSNDWNNAMKEYTELLLSSSKLSTSMSPAQMQKSIELSNRMKEIIENYSTHGNLQDAKKADKAQARAEKEEAKRQEEEEKAQARAEAEANGETPEPEAGKGLLSKMKAAGNKMAESTTNLYNKAKDKIVQDKPEKTEEAKPADTNDDVDVLLDNFEMQMDELKIAVNKKNTKQFARIMKNAGKDLETLNKLGKTLEQQQRLAEQCQRMADYSNKMAQQL